VTGGPRVSRSHVDLDFGAWWLQLRLIGRHEVRRMVSEGYSAPDATDWEAHQTRATRNRE
jgi:hypothetical protein